MKRENKKQRYNNNKSESKNNANVVIIDDLFVFSDSYVENVNLSRDKTDWVVDSGTYAHATSRHDIFLTYETDDFGVIRTKNNRQANVI